MNARMDRTSSQDIGGPCAICMQTISRHQGMDHPFRSRYLDLSAAEWIHRLEAAEKLEEIRDRLLALLEVADLTMDLDVATEDDLSTEGKAIVSGAKGSWIQRLREALHGDHEYIGGSKATMADTIQELRGVIEFADGGFGLRPRRL